MAWPVQLGHVIAVALAVRAVPTSKSVYADAITPMPLGVWGDGMVLQHDKPTVHGCGAQPTARITAVVEPGGEMAVAASRSNGCFVVQLAPRPVMTSADEAVSISLRVDSLSSSASTSPSSGKSSKPSSKAGAPFATATGVLFGHTILCSGQSNMVHPLSYDYNATEQIAAARLLPNLRLFQVGRQWSDDSGFAIPLSCTDTGTMPTLSPPCNFRNRWLPASPSPANFSAVCYLTAQELMRAEFGTTAAVGLVEADWGGSVEETWQTREHAVAHGCAVPPVDPNASCPLGSEPMSPIREGNWACLLHGMIEPLSPSLRPELVLWYQGEANAGETQSYYQCLLESMVHEWRGIFNNSALPFFLVQLAPYWLPPCGPDNEPSCGIGDTFPHARIAQATAMNNVDAVSRPAGYCVSHDIGDCAGGIHPHNKTEVGRRLALVVRSKMFGESGLPLSPEAIGASVKSEQNKTVVSTSTSHVAPTSLTRSFAQRPSLRTADVVSVGKNSQEQLEVQIAFTAGTKRLVWGPTHNCSKCCDSTTRVVDVCMATNCSSTAATWSSLSASWDATTNTLIAPVPTSLQRPRVVRYAWSNFPECVLFDALSMLPVGPFYLLVM